MTNADSYLSSVLCFFLRFVCLIKTHGAFVLLHCCLVHLRELLLQQVDLVDQGPLLLMVLPEVLLQRFILPLQVLRTDRVAQKH